jgi:hypothetical protein
LNAPNTHRRTSLPRRRSGALRLASSASVALLLMGTVGEVVHFAAVRHAACAVHGDSHHEDGFPAAHATSHAASHAASHDAAHDAHAAVRLPGDEGHHDHCDVVVTDRRVILEAATGPTLVTPLAPRAPPMRASQLLAAAGEPLHRLAPKGSPPV